MSIAGDFKHPPTPPAIPGEFVLVTAPSDTRPGTCPGDEPWCCLDVVG